MKKALLLSMALLAVASLAAVPAFANEPLYSPFGRGLDAAETPQPPAIADTEPVPEPSIPPADVPPPVAVPDPAPVAAVAPKPPAVIPVAENAEFSKITATEPWGDPVQCLDGSCAVPRAGLGSRLSGERPRLFQGRLFHGRLFHGGLLRGRLLAGRCCR